MGGYYECKIAEFIISFQEKLKDRAHCALFSNSNLKIIKYYVKIISAAIDFNEDNHLEISNAPQRDAKILKLANNIPVRGH